MYVLAEKAGSTYSEHDATRPGIAIADIAGCATILEDEEYPGFPAKAETAGSTIAAPDAA